METVRVGRGSKVHGKTEGVSGVWCGQARIGAGFTSVPGAQINCALCLRVAPTPNSSAYRSHGSGYRTLDELAGLIASASAAMVRHANEGKTSAARLDADRIRGYAIQAERLVSAIGVDIRKVGA